MSQSWDWDWVVRAYYTDDVAPPKRPGKLAFETVHREEHGRDLEIEAARSRPDIGTVTYGAWGRGDTSAPSDWERMQRAESRRRRR